jgi:digeranylgeranylglycerophospholipid reductase
MKNDYDAIVIGGGPSGSSFARVAATNGMNVLVIDKRKEIGVPVRCGEGLGAREVVEQGLEVPKRAISTDIYGARVIAPNGKDIRWKEEGVTTGWVLERKIFDKWLCELAIEKGAEVRTYVRALDLVKENGKIVGVKIAQWGKDEHEIRAPLVVSAEGMEAHIAKKAGFDTTHRLYDVDTCYQYEMKSYDHENLIELYFGNKIAPRGYVWIFPKSDKRANVGIGIGGNLTNGDKNGIPGADPKKLLDDFIANHPQLKDASTLDDFGGVISVGAPLNEFVKDNFMVIGTAAKQVDPIHGGGIALAMECGVLAAEVALKAKSKGYTQTALMEYEKTWKESAGKKVAKRLLLRKVVEQLSDDDLNYIFNSITQQDLNNVMAGNFAGPVAKVLAGRPQLLKVLSVLVS